MEKVELVEKKAMTSYVWTFFGLKKVAVKIVSRLYKDFAKTRLSLEVVAIQICSVTYEITTLKKWMLLYASHFNLINTAIFSNTVIFDQKVYCFDTAQH